MVTHFKHHMGENLEDYYKLGDVLGTGSFSKVIRATELATGKDFAVKCMTKEGDERKTEIITTEIEILKRVDHPNVVKLHEIFETDTDLYIVMQLINGGELFEKIVQLTCYTEQDASKIVRQLLLGIQGLHSERVVHRDLKPENLLLSDDSFDADVLITDFELSFVLPDGEDLMLRAVGTPGYIAPEVLATLDTGEGYGREIDLWSAGVIMYILLCGFPPFYGDDEEEVYEKTETGDYSYPSPFWDNISDLAKDMIDGLLRLDPRQRLTMDDALSHPWIQQFESYQRFHCKILWKN